MNIKQLRCVCEVARCDLSVTRAAAALHTSQPGVSMQIQQLERELGIQIFERQQNRLLRVTPEGQIVIERAQRALFEIDALRRLSQEQRQNQEGSLVVATTHARATMLLPPILSRFIQIYPKVAVTVKEVLARDIVDLLRSHRVDIGIFAETEALAHELAVIPCQRWPIFLFVSRTHPLAKKRKPTLAEISAYPLVQYESGRTGVRVMETFAAAGLAPRSLIHLPNVAAVKAHVELGQCLAIMPEFALDAKRDKSLKIIDLSHIFESSTTYVLLHPKQHLRPYGYDFLEMLSPTLQRSVVQEALERQPGALNAEPALP